MRFKVYIAYNVTAKFGDTDCRDRVKMRMANPIAAEEKPQASGVTTKFVQCHRNKFGLAMNLVAGCRQS
jgi:hypothetical protein